MSKSMFDRIDSRNVLWTVALVAAIHLITLLSMPHEGLWIVDNENRFLQTQALADNGFSDYIIPWPGRAIDSQLAMSPLRFNPEGTFHQQKDGQLISVFQPAFIMISAFFFQYLGFYGLYVLPLAATMLMLLGVARLASGLYTERLAAHLAVILAGLATPIWFYSQTFWEHTTAACLCVWGMVFVVRYLSNQRIRDLALGFAFLVLAVFFRDVLGIFAVLVLGLLLLRFPQLWLKTTATAGLVLGVGVALLMLFQWATVGKPLGFHAGTLLETDAGIIGHLMERPRLFFLFFCASHPERAWSFLMAAPFVVAFVLRPRYSVARFRPAVSMWALAALISGAIYLSAIFTTPNILRHLLMANSFFMASPILILGLLRHQKDNEGGRLASGNGFLLSVIGLYLIAYCLVAPWAGAVSLHWGARPVFAMYALMAVTAAGTLSHWLLAEGKTARWRSLTIGLLLVVSVAAQVKSVDILSRKKAFSERLSQTAASLTQPIVVTNVWWLGHEMYQVFFDKSIFYIQTQEQLESLEAALAARGHHEFIYATRPHRGPKRPGELRVDDGGWNFYSLDFIVAPVRGAQPRP